MKMILNEYRLMPWQKEAQDLVAKHMEDFFFGDGAALPPGYVPQQAQMTPLRPARRGRPSSSAVIRYCYQPFCSKPLQSLHERASRRHRE